MPAYQFSAQVARGGARLSSFTDEVDEEWVQEFEVEVAASQTDYALALEVDFSELKGVYIYADQACTLETEDGAAAEQTFTFAAGEYLFWSQNSVQAAPFTTDFTGLYVTTGAIEESLNLYIVVIHQR